jgi:hypothetical protein
VDSLSDIYVLLYEQSFFLCSNKQLNIHIHLFKYPTLWLSENSFVHRSILQCLSHRQRYCDNLIIITSSQTIWSLSPEARWRIWRIHRIHSYLVGLTISSGNALISSLKENITYSQRMWWNGIFQNVCHVLIFFY